MLKRKKITKNISYKSQFIDSAKFMASSLSSLVDNLAVGIHKIKCKHGHNSKANLKYVELNTKIVSVYTKTLKMV